VDALVTDVTIWERLLLKAGYRRSVASFYTTKYSLLDAPIAFKDADVPRVRLVDRGVRQLRYVAELEEDKAMGADEWKTALAAFVNAG